MALHDVADLVAEGGRQFGLVVEQGEQPTRHHHIAAGRVRIGPAPENLAIPPYSFLSDEKIKIG